MNDLWNPSREEFDRYQKREIELMFQNMKRGFPVRDLVLFSPFTVMAVNSKLSKGLS